MEHMKLLWCRIPMDTGRQPASAPRTCRFPCPPPWVDKQYFDVCKYLPKPGTWPPMK